MDAFRTVFDIPTPDFTIDHHTTVLMIGSCFAENIASKLRAAKFKVLSNPAGVVYNPLSVAAVFDAIAQQRVITKADLEEEPYGGVWSSFLFHGSFSDTDPNRAAAKMNDALTEAKDYLDRADTIIVTLGTSWIYELIDNASVVVNCHKFPANNFRRRRLESDETEKILTELMSGILVGKNVIFTVSPVRHLKDGPQGNSVSKAALMLAIDNICRKHTNASYFPAYELVYDDLRDYRFYAQDMVHLSPLAVDYIWDRFCGWAMTDRTRQIVKEMDRINTSLSHRPLNPESTAHADFRRMTLERIEKLGRTYPTLDFEAEKELLKR